MNFEVGGDTFRLPMPGRHFVANALAAIAVAREFGVPARSIAAAFDALRPVNLRGGFEEKAGATFIIDCYNANPSSMKSALELLNGVSMPDRRVAVVGDMLELGAHSQRLHRALGRQLALTGVRETVAIGAYAPTVAEAARAAGLPGRRIHVAADAAQAADVVRRVVKPGDTVLLKASRGIKLEQLYETL
jgi:UDP-N-acetylmuramyl pentapeptide synthase